MTVKIDCAEHKTKQQVLGIFLQLLEEMHAANYDAFIDAAATFEEPLEIEICHLDKFENPQALQNVLDIICRENPLITVTIE